MKNIFTIDLEEWFCSHNLQNVVKYEDWDQYESRVEESVFWILNLLEKHSVYGTFFVLGWVAERYPDLIREVAERGHEIASHGYSHRLCTQVSPEYFEEDLKKSVRIIEQVSGQKVNGFRAPAFSITKETGWTLDILKRNGIMYDSSVYPISYHPDYGNPNAELMPFFHENGLLEMPMSCSEFGDIRVPCSGGAYFRVMPYSIFKTLVKRSNQQGRALNFYLHPWEIDSEIPRLPVSRFSKFRHYTNLKTVKGKMEKMISDFEFVSMREWISEFVTVRDSTAQIL